MKKISKKSENPWLRDGDTVDVIAPASSCDWKVFLQGRRSLEANGLKLRYASDFMRANDYTAQTVSFRVADLKRTLFASDAKIIWCARGGYGCQQLIPELYKLRRPSQKKLVIGYSDITALQLFLMQNWGWPVMHASLVTSMADKKAKFQTELLKILKGQKEFVQSSLQPLNAQALKTRSLRATCAGGNLKVVQSALHTRIHPRFSGKIVFFEDVNERGYAVDRMLTQLTQAGVFGGVKAVVFGDLIKAQEPSGKNFVTLALQRFADASHFPVLARFPFGHGNKKKPVPMGTRAELTLGPKAKIMIWGP